jgi:Protein of unknown function (DUF4236)
MPFYLRKAISAGPFRFNLSKGGVGLSVGVRGLRFGIGPRGNYINAGRGGLYYRTSLGRAGQKNRQPPRSQYSGAQPPPALPPQVNQKPSVEMVEVDSGDVLAMRDAQFGELLDEINAKQKQIAYSTIFGLGVGAVGLGILYAVGSGLLDLGSQADLGRQVGFAVLLLALPAWAIGRWVDSYKRRSVLFYDLDQDASKAYEAMTRAFDEMMACAGKWHVETHGEIHDLATRKRQAGATGLVKKKATRLAYGAPKVIASNITPPSAQLGRQSIYFFPDAAFIVDGKRVGAIGYANLNIDCKPSPFIEEGNIPADAKVIEQTWKYLNKKGGPDRRFSNNYQIPVCLYELAQFSSDSGLNERLQFSRSGVVGPFANAIKVLSRRMRGQLSATATVQTPAPLHGRLRPGAKVNLAQKAHEMLQDTKADFFRRFKESPNLSDDLAGMRERIFSNFDFLVVAVLCTIATADGPINAKEADVINLLLGREGNETSYNEFLSSLKNTDIPQLFGSIIGVAIQLNAVEQGTNYDPQSDSIVKCFEMLGQAVSSADGDVNQSELASLSNFIAISKFKATEFAREIHSQTDAGRSHASVANQDSTPQPRSGGFVSGDGGYGFDVVGESHYQVELERIVGGRTENSARYKCVATLTPEPDNPYDPQAVCVTVNRSKVANLSRDWAVKFNAALASSGYARATCNALIVGGWGRRGDRGHFGIKLDIALPLDLKPTGSPERDTSPTSLASSATG